MRAGDILLACVAGAACGTNASAGMKESNQIRVTVWGENLHEKKNKLVADVYPRGMHECIADALRTDADFAVRTSTLDQPEHGLTKDVLDATDVLTWWGHMGHGQVQDAVVDRVQ